MKTSSSFVCICHFYSSSHLLIDVEYGRESTCAGMVHSQSLDANWLYLGMVVEESTYQSTIERLVKQSGRRAVTGGKRRGEVSQPLNVPSTALLPTTHMPTYPPPFSIYFAKASAEALDSTDVAFGGLTSLKSKIKPVSTLWFGLILF